MRPSIGALTISPFPNAFEPTRRERRVAGCILDVAVPEAPTQQNFLIKSAHLRVLENAVSIPFSVSIAYDGAENFV
jgi:hypothetical protein